MSSFFFPEIFVGEFRTFFPLPLVFFQLCTVFRSTFNEHKDENRLNQFLPAQFQPFSGGIPKSFPASRPDTPSKTCPICGGF